MRVQWSILVAVLLAAGVSPVVGSESDVDAKAAKLFKVRWSSVRYNKSVEVRNPDAIGSGSPQSMTEQLTLSLEVEIRDPNRVLGTGREGVITEITDGKGHDVAVGASVAPTMSRMELMRYQELRYHMRFQQPTVPKWRELTRRILGRPPRASGPPTMVRELQPNHVSMQLDLGLLAQAGGDLRSVKGYFNALVAGSMEYVDVPFEPNNTWVRLTPDVAIRVKDAIATMNSYQCEIETRPPHWNLMHRQMSGQPLPTRIVVGRQLIGADGRPLPHGFGGGTLMGSIAGRSSGSGSNLGNIKAIRFQVAVSPAECKVPFEARDVPLPKPDP